MKTDVGLAAVMAVIHECDDVTQALSILTSATYHVYKRGLEGEVGLSDFSVMFQKSILDFDRHLKGQGHA